MNPEFTTDNLGNGVMQFQWGAEDDSQYVQIHDYGDTRLITIIGQNGEEIVLHMSEAGELAKALTSAVLCLQARLNQEGA